MLLIVGPTRMRGNAKKRPLWPHSERLLLRMNAHPFARGRVCLPLVWLPAGSAARGQTHQGQL